MATNKWYLQSWNEKKNLQILHLEIFSDDEITFPETNIAHENPNLSW